MKRFRCLRPFALLLSLLMLIYAFPFSTTALTTTDASDIAAEPTASLSDIIDTEAISGVSEVTDLREENVKHFALPDGSYTAVTYARPVHRKDKNGKWQDIDNSLSMKAVKNTERYATSDMRVSFSKTYREGEALLALSENGYTVQMSPLLERSNAEASVMALTPAKNQAVTITNAEKRPTAQRFDTIEEAAAVNNKSSIVYENVKANTDLEYVLDGNDVKENIIVKSVGGSYVYRFTLSLTGLSAALLPSGDISLTDSETGAPKYTIPAPYMYDANGTLSHNVHYTLTPAGSGSYTLTVTASEEWINAENRAFPVVIDPTVTNTFQIFDTYIFSTAPSANYDSITLLPVYDETIVYFKWALPTLPDGSVITSANLHVMPINLEWGPIWIGAYRMLQNWLSSSITWNSASSSLTNFGMASTPLSSTYISTGAVYTAIDITDAAKEWYVDRSTNQGVALKKLDGDSNRVLLYSSEADSGKKAYFSVDYILFENGTYFIQNVATGRYIDVEGPSVAEGAIIQEWSFHGKNQSKWNLMHLSDGIFRIQSVYSNRYMRGHSSTNSITQTSTQDTYSSWALYPTPSGNYKIICKGITSGANVLGVRSSTGYNGSDLTMTSYVNDSNYCDEWRLYRINHIVNLDVLYDYAYNNRNSSAASRIQNALLIFQQKYLTEFGILINAPTPTIFSSFGDSACSSTPTASCSHVSETECYNSVLYIDGNVLLQTYHHKNLKNMMLRIPLPDLSSTFRIAFLGHNHCVVERTESGNFVDHFENPYFGLAYSNRGLAAITNFGTPQNELKTLIHEFGHFYGAPDHYGGDAPSTDEINATKGSNLYSRDCIYGEHKDTEDVLEKLTICDGCKSIIKSNASHYNHE